MDLIESANKLLDLKGKQELTELLESQNIEIRICSQCEDIMIEGYCIEGGEAYYCSSKCLEKNMTEEEYNELYENSDGTYWTEWF